MTRLCRAVVGDADAIAAVHVAGWRFACTGLLPASVLDGQSVAKRASFWRRYIADAANWPLFVSKEGDDIVGFASASAVRDDDLDAATVSELTAIYLLESAAGRGLGGRLLERCREEARSRGFTSMTLWVLETNRRAIRFYARHGFAADGTRKVLDRLRAVEIRMRTDSLGRE